MSDKNIIYTKQEIINALKMIKDICNSNNDCRSCPLRNISSSCCYIKSGGLPCYWNIVDIEEQKEWRTFND